MFLFFVFFFSSRRRHTRWPRDWSSDVCSSDLVDRQDDDARESQSLFGISAARCAEDSFVEFGQGDNADRQLRRDRKSTRLNSSHVAISYAVFCLKKKNIKYLAH